MFVKPKIDDEWEIVNQASSITPDNLEVDPITCTDVMAVGLPLFIVGFASGRIKLLVCETGKLVCEIGAHSR